MRKIKFSIYTIASKNEGPKPSSPNEFYAHDYKVQCTAHLFYLYYTCIFQLYNHYKFQILILNLAKGSSTTSGQSI